MILLILGILLILFFFVVLYFCARTWRALHLVALTFVFLAAVGFLVLASMSLKARHAGLKVHDQLAKELAAEKANREKLLYGDLTEVIQTTPSLRSTKAALVRAVLDRGRVWRHCTGSVDMVAGTITVITTPSGATEGEAASHGIQPNTVLYLFKENEVDGLRVPDVFLGEFQAASATETSVTLKVTIPLREEFMTRPLQQSQAADTFALYEQMPRDSHYAFAAGKPDDQHFFGLMDEEKLRQWLPKDRLGRLQDYETLIDQYARDGQRALASDPSQNTWIKVKFLKQHEVDVDAARSADSKLRDNDFDLYGKAKLDGLRRGKSGDPENAVFEPNDIGIFEYGEARRLISQKICDGIEPIYIRPLNDYAFAFHEHFRRSMLLAEDASTVQRNTEATKDADQKANEQIQLRTAEKEKLGQDLDKMRLELAEITQYVKSLGQQYEEAREQLSQLYRTNLMLVEELVAIQKEMADEIDRRAEAMTD